jgi:hypothetical protein
MPRADGLAFVRAPDKPTRLVTVITGRGAYEQRADPKLPRGLGYFTASF